MLLERLHFSKDTLSELVKIALPMVVSQGTFAVMIFTDRYFMSQIDPVHMAAALGGGVATYDVILLSSVVFKCNDSLYDGGGGNNNVFVSTFPLLLFFF